jgi:type IV secretory pathway VirB10-like protein
MIHALADRTGFTAAQYEARARGSWALAQSLEPRDSIDLFLVGQLMGTSEMFTDAMRDVLNGVPDALKQRTRSSAIAMGRLALAQLAEFERRRIQPQRTEAAAEARTAPPAKPDPEPPRNPQADTAPDTTPASPATPTPEPTSPAPDLPEQKASWVNEPDQEWLEETPILAARSASVAPAEHRAAVKHSAAVCYEALPDPGHPPDHAAALTMAVADLE